jgi:hypothetical protein
MRRPALLAAATLFAASYAVFIWSPNHQMSDSGCALLVSENLIRHRDLDLSRYHLDAGPGTNYRLEHVGGRVFYYFPLGSSILSVPYLIVDRLFARGIVDPDGAYVPDAEKAAEARLAALLMAGFTVIIFWTACLLLPVAGSFGLALVVAFGTQVYSTTSRTLWSDDWALVLLAAAVYLLLRAEVRGGDRRLVWLATLESWAYMVRPTNGVALAGTGLFLLLVERRASWRFFVSAGVWLSLFVGASLARAGQPLPAYFQGRLIGLSAEAMVGILLSPSRGLFVCVPALLALLLLLVRYRRWLRGVALARLAGGICAGHWMVISAFEHWWGGHCFGARLCVGMVPWLALLAILGIDAAIRASAEPRRPAGGRFLAGLALSLCLLSVAVNTVGAVSAATVRWNVWPENVDGRPERLWSWRHPQVLAGLEDGAEPHPR